MPSIDPNPFELPKLRVTFVPDVREILLPLFSPCYFGHISKGPMAMKGPETDIIDQLG